MIYLGKTYIDDTKKLLDDEYFTNETNKFKNCVCEYDKIDFIGKCLVVVYKFKKPELQNLLQKLTNKYENNYHAKCLHITIGSLTQSAKYKFMRTTRLTIEKMLKDYTFTISEPGIIEVDTMKRFQIYKKF